MNESRYGDFPEEGLNPQFSVSASGVINRMRKVFTS